MRSSGDQVFYQAQKKKEKEQGHYSIQPPGEDFIEEKNDGMVESQAPPEDSQGQILGPEKANEDPKAEQIATTNGTEEPSTSGLRRAPSQIFGDKSSMPKMKKQKLAVTDSQP